MWLLYGRYVSSGLLAHNTFHLCIYIVGVVAQQLLLLPYHLSRPTPVTFLVTHVFLAGTRSSVLRDKRYGLRVNPPPPNKQRTLAERREAARPVLESTFDPKWLANKSNQERLQWWLNRVSSSR